MKRLTFIILMLSVLAFTACADPHGYAAGDNEGASAGIDIFKMKLP